MKNFIGQELNVGDVVAYVTRTKNPETRLGIITRFCFEKWGKNEVCVPVVYSWNRWNKGGFARRLAGCDHVFLAPGITADEAKERMLAVNKYW